MISEILFGVFIDSGLVQKGGYDKLRLQINGASGPNFQKETVFSLFQFQDPWSDIYFLFTFLCLLYGEDFLTEKKSDKILRRDRKLSIFWKDR